MDLFPNGAFVRLRSRARDKYVHADEDARGVSLRQLGAAPSVNAVWKVEHCPVQGRGGDAFFLLQGAAYGRYLSVTNLDAPRGHRGVRVLQRDYTSEYLEPSFVWTPHRVEAGQNYVRLHNDEQRCLRANGKNRYWNDLVTADDRNGDETAMMQWRVEAIPLSPEPTPLLPPPQALTWSLLRTAICHISYIRGLVHETYFSEKSILSPEMKNEKLLPVNHALGRLLDLMERVVSDALEKKYLKTLLFCICEKEEGPMIEEYAFSFRYPNLIAEDVAMIISRTGSKKGSTAFKPNNSKLTPDQMRRYGCKMIRTLVSLTQIVDAKSNLEERTILVKLIYNNDVTPEDYEPPRAENEAVNIWNKNKNPLTLKMEIGNVNSKHLVLALKVKGDQESCDDKNTKCRWDERRLDNDFDIDDDFPENQLCETAFGYVLCTSRKKFKFILDSGATHHICNDVSIMRNLRDVRKEDRLSLYSAGGKEFSAERMGLIDLKNFSLNPVGLIPSMSFNVVSVGQLAKQGLMICCGNGQFNIYDVTQAQIVGEGYLDTKDNEYVFRTLKWSPKVDKLIEIPENDTNEGNDEQQAKKIWFIDTGCAQHLVPDGSLLTNLRYDKRPFQTAKGTIWSSQRGKFTAGKLVLNDVLCSASVHDNLMSGPSLDRAGYRMTFFGKTCTLVHKDGLELRGVGIQDVNTNTYYLTPQEEEKEEGKVKRAAEGDTEPEVTKRRRFE